MKTEIKKLEHGRFASFYGYGNQPEETAMTKMFKWCEKRNIDLSKGKHHVFGFNNLRHAKGNAEESTENPVY